MNANPKPGHTAIQTLAFSFLTALLCSCAATSVKNTWKSPDYKGAALTKLAVIAVAEQGLIRQGMENRLVAQLRGKGATAFTTFDLLSLVEIKDDKPAAAARFRAAGAEAVVLMRLVDMASYYREVRPGPEAYASVITGIYPGTWYDYYSVAFMSMSPTYGDLKQQIYLETSVYDLQSAKRVWSGLTKTVFTDRMDRVAEMDPIVAKVIDAMQKDGVVP